MRVGTLRLAVAAIAICVLGAGCANNDPIAGSDPTSDSADTLKQASAICEEFRGTIDDLEPQPGAVSASTVGQMRQILAELGKEPISEWADLEESDFVAVCGYPLGEPEATAGPTTTCAGGEVRSLAEPAQAQYLVTENGVGVRDVTQDNLPAVEPPDCP